MIGFMVKFMIRAFVRITVSKFTSMVAQSIVFNAYRPY